MRRIDAYLGQHGATQAGAVGRFELTSLVEFDDLDDVLDAEAAGEDVEERQRRSALGKLKRWLRIWKSLPESKKKS